MADSKHPSVTMETGPVICGRCRRPLSPLVVEEIQGLLQLHSDTVLVQEIKANCLACGWTFRWHRKDDAAEKMTVIYNKLLEHFKGYTPE